MPPLFVNSRAFLWPFKTASRSFWLLRSHRPSQFVRRGISIVRRKLARTAGRRWTTLPSLPVTSREEAKFDWLVESRLAANTKQRININKNECCFLNESRTLGEPVDWRPDATPLWRFHLHYHEFLFDLMAEGDFERAWQIVAHWIEQNQPTDSTALADAWHPFCISRRLPVWIAMWTAALPPEQLRQTVLDSVYCQTRFLAHHLEKDLGGNHLLENLRALTLAAAFLDGSEADGWLSDAARLFRRELSGQILPHGEHFERSPMYHAHMLEAVLDVRDATADLAPNMSVEFASIASNMAAFLQSILHPDGNIPLFGDSAFGECPSAAHLIARAGQGCSPSGRARLLPSCAAESDSRLLGGRGSRRAETASQSVSRLGGSLALPKRIGDYWVAGDADDFLLFDAGNAGPDHLPAHAHADLLTLEASVDGKRLFVDSGVFNYQDDEMRRYCRSTAAHNVLQVDDMDQFDLWSRFRMGYRGWTYDFKSGQCDGYQWAEAWHDAYRRIGVPQVIRRVRYRPGGPWIISDRAIGKGIHRLTSRLHIHPDWMVEQTGDSELTLQYRSRETSAEPEIDGDSARQEPRPPRRTASKADPSFSGTGPD